MKKNVLLISLYLLVTTTAFSQTVTDVDGNTYNTISIGNQVWIAENLKTKKFNNQDPIPLVIDSTLWSSQTQAAYCYYQEDEILASEYGNLYNWYVVNDTRNVCPAGYHVPAIAEWESLINFLGGETVAGGKLKEAGFSHWLSPNTGATNSSGFNLLPSGWRAPNNGSYENLMYMAYQWSSSSVDALNSSVLLAGYDSEAAYTSDSHILTGLPIRCVQDENSSHIDNLDHSFLFIFPNPANDILNIQGMKNAYHTVKLLDLNGKLIMRGNIENDMFRFNVSNIPSGSYVIELYGEAEIHHEKMIIQH
jgi:uncharacterized protein (TIGR02145 family)